MKVPVSSFNFQQGEGPSRGLLWALRNVIESFVDSSIVYASNASLRTEFGVGSKNTFLWS